jgi:hypothetical protein
MVQFRENPANCWYAWYGFSLCIVFIVTYPILIGYVVYLLNRKAGAKIGDESKIEKSTTSRWREVPESMNMICSDFKNDYWIQRNFMLMFLLESFINSMSYFWLQDYGTFQAFLYTMVTSVLFLLGPVFYRPFTSKLQNFIFGLNYTFKLMLAIIAVFIGVRESTLSEDQLNSVGIALIVVIVAGIVSNALIVVGMIISGLVQACKARFRKKTQVLPDETPAILAVKNLSLNINSIEKNSNDPFYNFSSRFKEIVGTPVSLERAETQNITTNGYSSSRTAKTSSRARLMYPNSETNESTDNIQFSPFRIEAQDFAKTDEQIQSPDDQIQSPDDLKTHRIQDYAAPYSQFKVFAKLRSKKANDIVFGPKVLNFNFDQ